MNLPSQIEESSYTRTASLCDKFMCSPKTKLLWNAGVMPLTIFGTALKIYKEMKMNAH